jgi:hypothetical protein
MDVGDSNIVGLASAFASVVLGLAVAIPRIMSGKKRDGLDKEFAEAQQKMLSDMQALFQQQISALKAANDEQTQKISAMHSLIDKYRIELTVVRNTLYEVLGVLVNMGVVLPKDTEDRVNRVLNGEEDRG